MNSMLMDVTPELCRAILDDSLTHIYAAKAVRDPLTRQLIDFKCLFANEAFLELENCTNAELSQSTMLTMFPQVVEVGLFGVYRNVVETGEPYRGEHPYHYPTGSRWFDMLVKKYADGIVVNFIDITRFKEAYQQTRQTAEMIETLVDNVPSAISLFSPVRDTPNGPVTDWVIERSNQAAARLMGRPIDQLEGQTYAQLFPDAVANGGIAHLNETWAGGLAQQYDLEYRTDGLNGWFEQRNVPVGDKLLFITNDITARKQTELQLRQLVEQFDNVVQVLPNGLVIAEAIRDGAGAITDFRLTLINPAARQLASLQPDDEGRTVQEVDPFVRQSGLFDRYVALVETGEPFYMENAFRSRDLALSASKFNDGFIVTFTDISERKQAERERQHQTNILQSTLDASISSILAMTAIRDESGQIVDFRMDKANRSVERSLGLTPEELEGNNLLELFPANVETGFFAVYAKAADTGEAQHITLPYTDDKGFDGWFEVSAVQYAPDQIVLTFMNVTESKRLEAQLRDSNESLDRFASVASHDLQEPLRKIKAFGDLLLEQYGPALGDGTDFLLRMRSATERMQGLIRDLLALSRLSRGAEVARRPVDLNQIVIDILDDLEVTILDTRADINIEPLPTLPGDPLQLRQVFQNLLSNAIKFSQPGVSPRIRVTSERIDRSALPADVLLTAAPAQTYWRIDVADEGIGFSNTYRLRIFEAFERLHGKKSAYSGTGIGLAIVQKVMQNHNGSATAQSREGEGATFSLYFPG